MLNLLGSLQVKNIWIGIKENLENCYKCDMQTWGWDMSTHAAAILIALFTVVYELWLCGWTNQSLRPISWSSAAPLGVTHSAELLCSCSVSGLVKAGTHRLNRWTSEAFGETQTRSGKNMFGRGPLRFNKQSLRRLDVGRLSHWIIWMAVC